MAYDSLLQYGMPNSLGLPNLNLNYGMQPQNGSFLNPQFASELDFLKTNVSTPTAMPAQPNWFDSFVGTKETPGWGGLALGAASGLANGFLGLQQYGIAKDTLRENKRQFALNFDAQRKTTNAALEDRQRRRVAERPDFAEPVDQYLAKYGI